MKTIFHFMLVLLIASVTSQHIQTCPTCLGRLEHNSPPFFSEELYQSDNNESNDTHEETRTESETNEQESQDGE